MQTFRFTVKSREAGLPARQALAKHFQFSRKLLRKIRWSGEVSINGEPSPLWRIVDIGDHIEVSLETHKDQPCLHFPADQKPIFQNDNLIIMNKKAGQVVHACLNYRLEDLCSLISNDPLHPVNRLDRDTTGLVMIALNGYTHHRLAETEIVKDYLAVCHGRFTPPGGAISAPIARTPDSLIERVVDPRGKAAHTLYASLAYDTESDLSLMRFRLITGRTHQIRVHAQYLGHPLLGDDLYGRRSKKDLLIKRQALHAYQLSFIEPIEERLIRVQAPLPSDLEAILQKFHLCPIQYGCKRDR